MGAFTMRSLRLFLPLIVLGVCHAAWAQSPTYGLGKTPTAEEIRAWDISIGPAGKELPPGKGSAKEGADLLHAEVRGMPRANRVGRPGSHADQSPRLARRLVRNAWRLASIRIT